jgi:hypothetical protein
MGTEQSCTFCRRVILPGSGCPDFRECDVRERRRQVCRVCCHSGKAESKFGALAGLRNNINGAAVSLHDLCADGKADSRPGILSAMCAFENSENPLLLLGRYSHSVVPDRYGPETVAALRRYPDLRRLGTRILDGISHLGFETVGPPPLRARTHGAMHPHAPWQMRPRAPGIGFQELLREPGRNPRPAGSPDPQTPHGRNRAMP